MTKRMPEAPTADEMLAAVMAIVPKPDNDPGVTVAEYADANGLNTDAARNALERAVKAGKLLKGKAWRPRRDGNPYPLPVYRPANSA